MSSAACAPEPASQPEASPRAIRAALLPEEQPEFDRQWRAALACAAETLNLEELHSTLDHWRRIAWMTLADPEAHRRMLVQADHTQRTGDLPPDTASADEVRALMRERLGL